MINTTWNPNELSGGATLSSDLLTLNMTTHSQGSKSTISKKKGKFYFEVKINSISSNLDIGIADSTYTYTVDSATSPNVVVTRETSVGTVGVAVNLDNDTVDFYKNGVFKESKIITSQLIGIEVFALVRSATSTGSRNVTGNFGATTFSYPVPNGFKAYNDIYSNKFLILSNDESVGTITSGGYSKNIVPILTSNTTPSPYVVSASTTSGSYSPYLAFDKITTANANRWASTLSSGWLKIDLGTPKKVDKYSVWTLAGTATPKDWTFEGSDTGAFSGEQVILDIVQNKTSWNAPLVMEREIINNKAFRFYRINVTANNGGSTMTISELEMFELIPSIYKSIPSLSEQNFVNYGINKSTQIDLNSQMLNKVFVEQSSNALGSGKVFSRTIDTTKTPIKKVSIK